MKLRYRIWVFSIAIALLVGFLQSTTSQPIRFDNIVIIGLLVWLLFGQYTAE